MTMPTIPRILATTALCLAALGVSSCTAAEIESSDNTAAHAYENVNLDFANTAESIYEDFLENIRHITAPLLKDVDIISKYGEPKFDVRPGSCRYRVLFYYYSDKTVVVVCEYGVVKKVEVHDFIPEENIAPFVPWAPEDID